MDPSTLKKFELFKDVDESALGKIAPFTMLVEFPEGKTVIQEGGFSNDFYAIEERHREGRARPARRSPSSAPATSSASRACSRSRSARPRSSRPRPLRALKIEHWEIPRMRKAMPEVLEQLQKTIEERSA